MHVVAKFWYRLYWWLVLIFTCVFVVGGVAFQLFPDLPLIHQFGTLCHLDSTTLVIAAIGLIYNLTGYWFIRKKNEPMAMLIASMLLTLLLLNGLAISDPGAGAWVYTGIWFVTAFFAGIFGLPFSMGTFLLAIMYILLTSRFQLVGVSEISWALLGGTGVAAVLGYFFWRPNYVNAAEDQMNHLSVMLQSNQEQSAILMQSIADGVIVTDTQGKISLMNGTAANLTGWPIKEATGIDIGLVFKVNKEDGSDIPPEEYPFTAVLAHRAFFNQVLQLTSRTSKKRVVSLVISPVVTANGEVYGAVAVLRDISQERAAEQQRGEFISTASHEMRTPVAAIEGYLALALNPKVSTVDERARGFLEKAHSSTQHLGQLFQDLLTSAKAEDGRLSNHPVVVEMGAFLQQTAEDLRFAAQKKSLATEFSIGAPQAIDATKNRESLKVVKPLYYALADPDRLREVITNIFDNAVKYTEQGKVSIGLTGDDNVVQFYIRDTGPGIPAEDVPHLFQKFYRVDNSATRTIGGTGLGLFIASKIIELYQGRIWVESELGKGSTFFINLPRLTNQRAAALQQAEASAGPPAPTLPATK